MELQDGAIKCEPPHKNRDMLLERNKCLKRYFLDAVVHKMVKVEYAKFSTNIEDFTENNSIPDMTVMDPNSLVVHALFKPFFGSYRLGTCII